ncbi:hypothetical protein LSAT2_017198 [Lamellibrachia satsuma]|nr:hypothetical protein LSAT2_017198 [Lamellibrachia satsuma]
MSLSTVSLENLQHRSNRRLSFLAEKKRPSIRGTSGQMVRYRLQRCMYVKQLTNHVARVCTNAENMEHDADTSEETQAGNEAIPLYDHPKFHQLMTYDLIDRRQAYLTLLVYLDLIENKGWWNMTFIPSAKLAMVLISGHSSRIEPKEVIAPIATDMNLSVSSLQFHLQSLEEELHYHAFVFALVDDDSSIVYYKMSAGLVPPAPPEMLEEKKRCRQRQFQLRNKRFVTHNEAAAMSADFVGASLSATAQSSQTNT